MNLENRPSNSLNKNGNGSRWKCLLPEQVQMIDEALASLGEFGEIHLIVEKGRLRFVVTQKSFDALKWTPKSIQAGE